MFSRFGGMDPSLIAHFTPPTRRLMAFADGENLVARYQAMVQEGFVPRDDVAHEQDVFVWHPGFTSLSSAHEILRVTYYASAVGDEDRQTLLREKIRGFSFNRHTASTLPNQLTPVLLKKKRGREKTKGLDIQLCVDVLGHVSRGNVDSILLLTGDGDFRPLIEEARRNGVQVFLFAFSNGLNPDLRWCVDSLELLDGATWKARPDQA